MPAIPEGAIRFNTDSQKLEFYAQSEWWNMVTDTPNLNGGARGVFGGGVTLTPTVTRLNVIEYITISSTGNVVDFGDLSVGKSGLSACSSSTRGVFGGGITTIPAVTYLNVIEYITIASTGNAVDFGDLFTGRYVSGGCASSTRGVFGGGITTIPAVTRLNVIEYITISSTGDAVDFGDLSVGKNALSACSSSTRGVFGGGITPTYLNTIEYITISSTGNVVDFGDLSAGNWGPTSCSSATRGIFAGGYNTPTVYINTIEYITLSSLGNAINFGDLITTPWLAGACSSSTRAIVGGGWTANPNIRTNVIQYVTIQSQGDAIDFGDLTAAKNALTACSNGHGGL